MLHAQIPLQNARNHSFRSGRLDWAADVRGAALRQSTREPAEDQLSCGGNSAGVKVRCVKTELRRVETEVVKNIRLCGIEHSKGASDDRVFRQRPREPNPRSQIPLVKLHAGMRHSARPVGGHDDGAIEIEVPDLPVRAGCQFVTQSEVDGKVVAEVEVILEEFGKIPVTGGIEACQEVLLVGDRGPKQNGRHSVAPIGGGQVVGVSPAEIKVPARIRKLEEIPLLAPKVDAKFQRMLAPDPCQRIRDLKNILEHMLGEPLRVAQRGEPSYIDVGEATGIGVAGTVDIGNAELCAQIFAEVKRQSIYGVAEVAPVQIVQHSFGKSMGVPNAQVLGPRVADARATVGSSPQRP